MSTQRETIGGRIALVIGHSAGLMDITALPIWIGMVLIGGLALNPQSAGLLATLFLASVVLSSLFFAPRINRINRKRIQPMAYIVAGLAFAGMANSGTNYALLVLAHIVAGLSVGSGLSITHGTMGGTANPHRTAAIAFTTLSLVSIIFMAIIPPLVPQIGPKLFFYAMTGIMFAAALAGLLAFPDVGKVDAHEGTGSKLPKSVWFGIAGVMFLMVTHAMVFGFVERIARGHGFSVAQITTIFIVSGVFNLISTSLSGLAARWLPAAAVVVAGPLIQLAAALVVTQIPMFEVYIAATCILIGVVTFTHVFAFGLLAKQDPSGRVVGATPVMVMTGSATGPLLGGVLAQQIGYGSLGFAALALGLLSATCFYLCSRKQA